MFECRNPKKPDCKGKYRSMMNTIAMVRCESCGHTTNVNNLKDEQTDHDIKAAKEKN